jgi:hypothetical protein
MKPNLYFFVKSLHAKTNKNCIFNVHIPVTGLSYSEKEGTTYIYIYIYMYIKSYKTKV